ncbi:MAG: Ig-like domain-containing protein [Pseudomonadota bacterium]
MFALKRTTHTFFCRLALCATALLSACGGGDQGRGPILGLGAAELVSVAVTPATASVAAGLSQQFAATATYSDGATRDVTAGSAWSSATPAVASVNAASGMALGLAPGASAIGASFGGKAGSAALSVTPALVVSVSVAPQNPVIQAGSARQLAVTATYTDSHSADVTVGAAFVSSAPAIASVGSSSGVATGLALGSSVITASFAGKSATTVVTVPAATLASIALTPASASLAMFAKQQFVATGTYSDGSTGLVTNTVSWSSGIPAVATIVTGGEASGVSVGSTTISATSGAISANATLNVTAAPATLSSIAVTPAIGSVLVGGKQQFVATGTFSDGSSAVITNAVSWTSSAPAIGTIVPGGLATGVLLGSTTIGAASGLRSASAVLNVTASAPTLSSIAVTPAIASVAVGGKQQFVATGSFSDGSSAVISDSVIWSSSLPAIGTILPGGLASGVLVGSSTIGAASGIRSGSAVLNVTAAVLPPVAGLDLKGAASFAVLAGTSITNNSGGTTLITGDVGSPSQTTDPTQVAGFTNYKSGAVLAGALADLQTAITDGNSRSCTVNSASGIDLGGLVFTPGVYCYAGSINLTGTFTLNGPGVYIFRTASTLNTTANSIVALTGGASADTVYWLPVAPTTLGANSVFKGSILGQAAAITMGDNATLLNGRVLTAVAVTLRNNQISK